MKVKNISDNSEFILTIGPNYKNHRGGIGAVIEIYSKYFHKFKFIATFDRGNILKRFYHSIYGIISIFIKLLLDKKISIIHIHGASYVSFYRKFIHFFIGKYIFKKKIIYHIHGAEYHIFYKRSNFFVKLFIKLFINNSDCVLCLSKQWENFINENFNPKKIEIIPNIIDYPTTSYKVNSDTYLNFLFLGSIGHRKGIFDLINVISKNKTKYLNKVRLIIGGNGDIDKLNKIIIEEGLQNVIEFVGWITNEEKIYWLQNTDIYILPSYNEGLPISILEAMSYGKPIISTNVGGIPEIVIPHKNGILIEPGNLQQIEYSLDFFINNKNTINSFGICSKNIVKKHYPDSVIDQLNNVYSQLID